MHTKSKKQNRKSWITDEIFELMEVRRKVKSQDRMDDYRLIHSRVIKECFKARESYLNTKCKEVETLYNIMPMEAHRKIRQLAGRYRSLSKHTGIKDNEGKLLTDESDICQRWSEYIENLYDDPNLSDEPLLFDGFLSGPEILKSELRQAIKTAKIRKAPGPDNVRVEVLKLLNETALKNLKHLMNEIYERGRLTKEMCQSVFIPLPKKAGTVQSDELRTISLMSHVTKILLKIVSQLKKSKIIQEIDVCQYGFRAEWGTRNAVFILKILSQRSIQMHADIYLWFVDYTKAFDGVVRNELMRFLDDLELDDKDLRLIQNLYYQQETIIRINDTVSKMVPIKSGMRQGCVLSPDLYSLFSEILMRSTRVLPWIDIRGVNVKNLRYADDTVLIAKPRGLTSLGTYHNSTVWARKLGCKSTSKRQKSWLYQRSQKPQFVRFWWTGVHWTT